MSSIRTLSELQDHLDREMSWRVKEISAFRLASKSNGSERKFFIRAGVGLVYAHWEGFIKSASKYYLNFVDNQGHTYRELKSCFAVFGLKKSLEMLSTSRKSFSNIEAFDFILLELDQRANLKMSSAIDTESNLTSKVFSNVAASLGICTDTYSTKFHLIDESLVRRRNKVAHGEYLEVSGPDFGELVDEMLVLMRNYKTDLENAASMKEYTRSA